MNIQQADPNALEALGKVAKSLTEAYAIASESSDKGGVPYTVLVGLKATLDKVRLAIEAYTEPPRLVMEPQSCPCGSGPLHPYHSPTEHPATCSGNGANCYFHTFGEEYTRGGHRTSELRKKA